MSDIAERLRDMDEPLREHERLEIADEIKLLRARVRELEEALYLRRATALSRGFERGRSEEQSPCERMETSGNSEVSIAADR
jgi:hypothetical protein